MIFTSAATAVFLLATSIVSPICTTAACKQQRYLQTTQCSYKLQQVSLIQAHGLAPTAMAYTKAWAADFGINVVIKSNGLGISSYSGGVTSAAATLVRSSLDGMITMSTTTCIWNPNSSSCLTAQKKIEDSFRSLATNHYCLSGTPPNQNLWNCNTVTQPNPLTVCAP